MYKYTKVNKPTFQEQRQKNESDLGPDPRRYLNNIDSDDDSDDKIGIGLKNLVNNPLFTVSFGSIEWCSDMEMEYQTVYTYAVYSS